jgi:hypothetical protein
VPHVFSLLCFEGNDVELYQVLIVNNSCCSIQGSELFSVAARNPECPHSTLVTSGQPEAILFLRVFVRVLELLSGIVNALINFVLIGDQHERK